MRRVPAIFVLLVTGFSSVAPMAFATTYTDTPACCRRDGKHRCQSDMAGMSADGAPGFQATAAGCPHRSPSATPVSAGQAKNAEFSVPQLPDTTLVSVPNSAGFTSEPVLHNSERGPPFSR